MGGVFFYCTYFGMDLGCLLGISILVVVFNESLSEWMLDKSQASAAAKDTLRTASSKVAKPKDVSLPWQTDPIHPKKQPCHSLDIFPKQVDGCTYLGKVNPEGENCPINTHR